MDPVEKELLEDDEEKKKDLRRSAPTPISLQQQCSRAAVVLAGPSSTTRSSPGCGRQSTSPPSTTATAPKRSVRRPRQAHLPLSLVWWELREERGLGQVGYNIKKQFKEENIYRDRESQLQAINNTFACVRLHLAIPSLNIQQPTRLVFEAGQEVREHYSKKGIHAVGEYPVFPDFDVPILATHSGIREGMLVGLPAVEVPLRPGHLRLRPRAQQRRPRRPE